MPCYASINSLIPSARFEHAVNFLLDNEGLLTDDPKDPGGITNFGISLKFLQQNHIEINKDGIIDRQDVIDLDVTKAKFIYYRYWWDKYKYDGISSLDIATKVFDLSVNMGAFEAHKLLQISINRLNDHPIDVDGILGANTLVSANLLVAEGHELDLLHELKVNAVHYYINLIADKPDLKGFENGWLKRANR